MFGSQYLIFDSLSPGPGYLLKSSGKIQAKTPQEVKTTPSQNDFGLGEGTDLVRGLRKSGQAVHAPKLPRSAGIPDSLATWTAARRVASGPGYLEWRETH
jgi:hypothetical protein